MAVWLLVAVACAASRIALAEPVPPPAGPELEAATAAVKGIYQDKAEKARSPADRAELAREIFSKKEATELPAERYALLQVAFAVASRGDDAALLITIADTLKASFDIDSKAALAEKLPGITGSINPAAWPATSARITALVNEAINDGQFEAAGNLVMALTSLAKRARDTKTVAAAAALRKALVDKKKADERFAALREAGARPDAQPKDIFELGRILCFARNDWAAGLPFLVRSGDPDLSPLAKAELSAVDAAARIKAADQWADYAEKAPLAERVVVREHAISIYTALLPGLSGLEKVRVDEAIDRLLQGNTTNIKDPNAWIVVFRSDSPDVWNTNSTDDPKNYAVLLNTVPPNVKYVRLRRANGDTVILGVDRQGLAGEVLGPNFGWNGSNEVFSGAHLLGLADRRVNVDQKTGVVALSRKHGYFTGWGFGHRIHHGGPAEVCWKSEWIPREVIEISVLSRPLTTDEQRFLLQ